MICPENVLYVRKNLATPPPRSPTILERGILTSRCRDSAKFALITRQNLFTPPIQRGLATPLVVLMMIAGEFAL
jgi:hypothetical protein